MHRSKITLYRKNTQNNIHCIARFISVYFSEFSLKNVQFLVTHNPNTVNITLCYPRRMFHKVKNMLNFTSKSLYSILVLENLFENVKCVVLSLSYQSSCFQTICGPNNLGIPGKNLRGRPRVMLLVPEIFSPRVDPGKSADRGKKNGSKHHGVFHTSWCL